MLKHYSGIDCAFPLLFIEPSELCRHRRAQLRHMCWAGTAQLNV